MTPERWRLLDKLCQDVLELKPGERASFLDRTCAADASLRAEVEALIRAHDSSGSFMQSPSGIGRSHVLLAGQTISSYQVKSLIGSGGMGDVYEAWDSRLKRRVAIKVLPAEFSGDAERTARFRREAEMLASLNHPSIVTIYDVHSDAGIHFIVMEFVEGRTLDRIIPPNGLRVAQALRYGVAIVEAVARAHGAGIVHRDLKPSNIMVTPDDRVKVLDLGLAKLFDTAGAPAAAITRASALTETGFAVGTAAYMSPEQAEGRNLDGRSDIFSFGAVLYEMVTGRKPFLAQSQLSTLTRILKEDPTPPSRLTASVSPELDQAILRCLRKDPARRYQTMADLKVALEDIATESAIAVQAPALPVPTARRFSWGWAAAIMLPLLLIGAYFAPLGLRSTDDATPLRAAPITSLPGVKRSPSFSPDGSQVAYAWNNPEKGNWDVYVQQIGAGSPLRLTSDPALDNGPMWSPDGRSIAFLRRLADPKQYELRLIPPLGGAERLLTQINVGQTAFRLLTLGWCPDSRCVLVTDSAGKGKPDVLFVVWVESGERRQLTDGEGQFVDRDPVVSPDGKWLLFRRDVTPFTGGLYLAPLGKDLTVAGDLRPLAPKERYGFNPTWMPRSDEILFSAKGGLWRLRTSPGDVPKRLPFVGEDGVMPVVSAGQPSQLAYVRSFADINIWRVETSRPGEAAASAPVMAISSTRSDSLPHFSPDGRRVTFTSNRSVQLEIWVSDANGDNAVQLTSQGAIPGFSRWSYDGKWIAYHSDADGSGDVFMIPAGGGKPRNMTADRPEGIDAFPSFSRDNQWIYFASGTSSAPAIWKLPVAGGKAVQVIPGGSLAIESIDGADLYYVESQSDAPGPLMRMPLKGGVPVKLVDNVMPSSFDVIDKGIYYMELVAGETSLRYFDFASRTSKVVARNLGNLPFVSGLTASPDGRAILYPRTDSSIDDLMLVEDFR